MLLIESHLQSKTKYNLLFQPVLRNNYVMKRILIYGEKR